MSATRFEAFGDSITAGKLATDAGPASCFIPTLSPLRGGWTSDLRDFRTLGEESTAAYPRALQSMLAGRYTSQTITIPNEGNSGEFVSEGKMRLPGTLNAHLPQVLLLQEGANDMNQPRPPLNTIVEDFRTMIREARARGIRVFAGTVLPQRQGAGRGYDFCDGVYDTVSLNERLRPMFLAEGATLVELYNAFSGQESVLLGIDGLHPNEAGYQKMAEVFYAAIRQQLEVP